MKLQRRSAISGDVGNDLGVLVEWSCVVGVMNLLWVDKPLLSRFELVRAGMNCIGSERVVLNGVLELLEQGVVERQKDTGDEHDEPG